MELKKLTHPKRFNMDQQTTTTAASAAASGGYAAYKIVTILLPIGASLLAFWLGLRFVPVRKGYERTDLINRVMSCMFSSFIVGIPALVLLHDHWPHFFDAAATLAARAYLPPETGFFIVTACVLVLAAIPGPWIVAGTFLWLEKRRGKDIGEIFSDLQGEIKNERGKREARRNAPKAPPIPHDAHITRESCAAEGCGTPLPPIEKDRGFND